MKFKLIAAIAVILVMLLATLVYLATKNSSSGVEGGEPLSEQAQP
jgi:hypothetical protein